MTAPSPICFYCLKRPNEIEEYIAAAKENETTPDHFVRREEGTYNPLSGHFACTDCYIRIGMPSAPGRGWVAP
jgi:hypothetical protein